MDTEVETGPTRRHRSRWLCLYCQVCGRSGVTKTGHSSKTSQRSDCNPFHDSPPRDKINSQFDTLIPHAIPAKLTHLLHNSVRCCLDATSASIVQFFSLSRLKGWRVWTNKNSKVIPAFRTSPVWMLRLTAQNKGDGSRQRRDPFAILDRAWCLHAVG
jgi:hypothetical protein